MVWPPQGFAGQAVVAAVTAAPAKTYRDVDVAVGALTVTLQSRINRDGVR